MNSQQLFYFNLIIGALLLAYFFLGRSKPKAPTKLNMRAAGSASDLQTLSKSESKQQVHDLPLAVQQSSIKTISDPKVSLLEPESQASSTSSGKTSSPQKQLSIFFMYNGHDWEAHQVLGIPQGASVDVATRGYQEQLKAADPASYQFYEAAYNAIFKKRRNERL